MVFVRDHLLLLLRQGAQPGVRGLLIAEALPAPAGYAPKVSIHVPAYFEPPEMLKQTLDAVALCGNAALFPADHADYLAWVRDPGHGFCSGTLATTLGGEFSAKLA